MTAQRVKRLAFMLFTCMLLLGIFLWLLGQDTPKKASRSLVIFSREPTDIQRLSIQNQKGGFTIRYQKNPDGYVLDDVPPELLDMDRFISLMVSQAALTAKSALPDPLPSPAAYGLDSPLAEIRLEFQDGSQFNYRLGQQETVSGDYYLQVDGCDVLYTYPGESAQALLSGTRDMFSMLVTPELTVSSPLSAIRDAVFSGKRLREPIAIHGVMGGKESLRTQALTFGAATHLVQEKGLHQLDQLNGIRILGSLLGIKAVRVMGYNLSGDEIKAYGFHTPDMQADFTLAKRNAPDEALSLSLVQAGEDLFYAWVKGRGVVYQINRPAFFDISYQDLIMRYFAAPMLMDITGLTVQSKGSAYEITFYRDEQQQAHAAVNGQAVDPDLFYAFYRLVTSAAADGKMLEDISPGDAPVVKLIYHYKSPEKPDDELVFYPHSPRRLAVAVNGVIEQDIRESFVVRLLEACENLLADKEIEEVW